MDWLACIQKTIFLLENHLTDENSIDVAKEVGVSSVYLQKGFSLMTGYSMGEYVRNRKLYLAALDVLSQKESLLDIAFKYGYENYESFNKAFVRFHGITPTGLRKEPSKFRTFLSLKIKIDIQGGNDMKYTIVKMPAFKLVGFSKEFKFDEAYEKIPKFWNEFMQNYGFKLMCSGKKPETEIEETICNCIVGKYGVCVDSNNGKSFKYFISGEYTDGDVPEGMDSLEIEEMNWAKFECIGPVPGAIQSMNTQIFKEWLPSNPDYEIAKGINIEFYSNGDPSSADYLSEIWIPVKKK